MGSELGRSLSPVHWDASTRVYHLYKDTSVSFFSALQALLALSFPLAFLPLAMHQPPLLSQYSNLTKILPLQCSSYDKDC